MATSVSPFQPSSSVLSGVPPPASAMIPLGVCSIHSRPSVSWLTTVSATAEEYSPT